MAYFQFVRHCCICFIVSTWRYQSSFVFTHYTLHIYTLYCLSYNIAVGSVNRLLLLLLISSYPSTTHSLSQQWQTKRPHSLRHVLLFLPDPSHYFPLQQTPLPNHLLYHHHHSAMPNPQSAARNPWVSTSQSLSLKHPAQPRVFRARMARPQQGVLEWE